jgi:uncharacterized membrane protein YfcA
MAGSPVGVKAPAGAAVFSLAPGRGLGLNVRMLAVLVSALAAVAAAFVKGVIGLGFPTLATPLLTLIVDVKIAVVVLIVPNIAMDAIQLVRRGAVLETARRLAVVLASGAVGTVIGTRLLVGLSSRTVTLVLGAFVLLFVALNTTRWAPRVPPGWERRLAPVAGLVAGVVGGITNVPGTPLAIYFYALGLDKQAFVRAVACTFMVYKLVQLGAVAWYGFLTWRLLALSLGLTVVALGGFALGLGVQDRLDARAFNRTVLAFLGALGLWLVVRASL